MSIDTNFDGLIDFVAESNRIEGIHRRPTPGEVAVHEQLLFLDKIRVGDLETFVALIQPGARLRREFGMDVRVGPHVPPPGGPEIAEKLDGLLKLMALRVPGSVYGMHIAYETLHPFTDGNGRSGRALWAWQMLRGGRDPFALPFLHRWYYDSLQEAREE